MNPFRNILRLSLGDFVAKALNFVAFVHLARTLGVVTYGVLEFAIVIQTYLMLTADGGLEVWATREAARHATGDRDAPAPDADAAERLAGLVLPLRLLLAVSLFAVVLVIVSLAGESSKHPGLRPLVVLFALTPIAQAISLKWLFLGRERMGGVATGLAAAQIIFAAAVLAFVRDPKHVIWVPVLRLAGDLVMAGWFWRMFVRSYRRVIPRFALAGAAGAIRPALTLGAGNALGLLSFNFSSLLLGVMLGAAPVGLYGAAYKPVTMALAMPLTYFSGLFPTLARTHASDRAAFRAIVANSLHLATMFAVPLGLCGFFLAGPVIHLLFGADYASSVPALRLLVWAASLVVLRGTFRHALNAAGHQGLDLRCASVATAFNVLLNVLLIPRHGIAGAAAATVASEVVWLALVAVTFHRRVHRVPAWPVLRAPAVAAALMAGAFLLAQPFLWVTQALIAGTVYLLAIVALGNRTLAANILFDRPVRP